MVMRKFQKPGFSGCPMPYLGPYHLHFLKVHRKCSRPDPIVLKGGKVVYKIPYRRARAWPSGQVRRASKGILHTSGKVTRTSLHLPSYLMLSYAE